MKRNIYRVLAASFATALAVTSPMASMTTYALGFNADAHDTDKNRGNVEDADDFWANFGSESSSSENSESSTSEPAYVEPANTEPAYTVPVQSEPTYSEASSGSSYSEASSSGSSNNGASSGDTSSTVATVKSANDVTVNVTGGQKFRIVMSADHKSYQVYHCGISKATFVVADADGNTATYSNVALAKGEDGLWYMNISFPQGVDTTGYTVGVTKGDATYLSTSLGVSGLKINGILALSTVASTEAN